MYQASDGDQGLATAGHDDLQVGDATLHLAGDHDVLQKGSTVHHLVIHHCHDVTAGHDVLNQASGEDSRLTSAGQWPCHFPGRLS